MQQRINIEQTLPNVYKAMYHLSGSLRESSLTEIQHHLITMRASQLNSCAFCINMHTTEALEAGEKQQRIFLLSAWRETDLFTPEEKALLALTEEVTLISQHGVSDETYENARALFDEKAIAEIISRAVIINAWNRFAVSTHAKVEVAPAVV
jgi:AhpD family alkylhydroperoxidase